MDPSEGTNCGTAKWAGVVLAVLVLGYIATALVSVNTGLTPEQFERLRK